MLTTCSASSAHWQCNVQTKLLAIRANRSPQTKGEVCIFVNRMHTISSLCHISATLWLHPCFELMQPRQPTLPVYVMG